MDRAQGLPGELDGTHDTVELAGHQGDVGGLDGHVGTGADRNAQVGLDQRGCVVDAIANHGDDPAFVLESANLGDFVFGQHLGQHSVDADLFGDRGSRAGVVAGDHGDLQPHGVQLTDHVDGVVFDGVSDREHAHDLAVAADEYRG